jgi:hypothetical protein
LFDVQHLLVISYPSDQSSDWLVFKRSTYHVGNEGGRGAVAPRKTWILDMDILCPSAALCGARK